MRDRIKGRNCESSTFRILIIFLFVSITKEVSLSFFPGKGLVACGDGVEQPGSVSRGIWKELFLSGECSDIGQRYILTVEERGDEEEYLTGRTLVLQLFSGGGGECECVPFFSFPPTAPIPS